MFNFVYWYNSNYILSNYSQCIIYIKMHWLFDIYGLPTI